MASSSHLHRLSVEIYPPSHPVTSKRGRGRREAAQPLVTGILVHFKPFQACKFERIKLELPLQGLASTVRAYPTTVEFAHQARCDSPGLMSKLHRRAGDSDSESSSRRRRTQPAEPELELRHRRTSRDLVSLISWITTASVVLDKASLFLACRRIHVFAARDSPRRMSSQHASVPRLALFSAALAIALGQRFGSYLASGCDNVRFVRVNNRRGLTVRVLRFCGAAERTSRRRENKGLRFCGGAERASRRRRRAKPPPPTSLSQQRVPSPRKEHAFRRAPSVDAVGR